MTEDAKPTDSKTGRSPLPSTGGGPWGANAQPAAAAQDDQPPVKKHIRALWWMVLGVIFIAGFVHFQKQVKTSYASKDRIDPSIEIHLEPGQTVSGASGLFTITVPGAGWSQIGRDDIHEGTDLSLQGPGSATRALAYVDCDDVSIDSRVRFRRGDYRDRLTDLTVEERRVLMDEPFLPLSVTRYEGHLKGTSDRQTAWAATVSGDGYIVEVLGYTRDADQSERIEALVRSMAITTGAMRCDG